MRHERKEKQLHNQAEKAAADGNTEKAARLEVSYHVLSISYSQVSFVFGIVQLLSQSQMVETDMVHWYLNF